MKSDQLLRIALLTVLAVAALSASGCSDDFYLSETEVAAYSNYLATDAAMNQHFSTLQTQGIQLQFVSTGSTPHLDSTNLLQLMRSTDMAQLETSGQATVRLDHLDAELEKQIDTWITGRLQLYTGNNNADARLTDLHDVHVTFQSNPTFTSHPDTQSISFNVTLTLSINCTIEVNALDSFTNFLFSITGNGINGTYPLNIAINNLQLNGQASLLSPFADAGRIRLQLTPQPGTIQVTDSVFSSGSAPGQVKDGVRQLLSRNLSSPVDEIFYQKYAYFSLPQISLAPSTSQTPGQLSVTYRPRPESASPVLHLVSRVKSGQLLHARRTNGVWSDYAIVPFPSQSPILNDPTLVHSGDGQLELCATDIKYNLVYAHWRDEAWGNFQTVSPSVASPPSSGFTGKPAALASAPGQVEIVVQGVDGNLWFVRRWNGNWFVPYQVPLAGSKVVVPPFRDPTAVQVGNKLTIIFADGKNRLCAIAYDLETNIWGQPTVIPTKEPILFAPAAAASGDRRVDLAYAGQSGYPYHRRIEVSMGQNFVAGVGTTGISIVGSETGLGSALIAAPVLICTGYGQLEYFGLFNNNSLYHNHFVNATASFTVDGRTVGTGWQGWTSPENNLLGASALWTGNVDDFTAAATRTGEVELAAHNSIQLVFHNSYQSARYGRDPWKTVGWRGYETTGGSKLLGKPALAAVDKNFELAFIGGLPGNGPTLHYALLPDSNAVDVTARFDPVRVAPNPIDPIVLSSGPGIIDFIEIASDGSIQHLRPGKCGLLNFHCSGYAGAFNIIPAPTGVTLGRLSAASYGNGQIDLVAVGSDRMIYQWRYRDSAWSAPTPIGGDASSAPVLKYVGAGQLELLAVSGDLQLMRWRFFGGSWTGVQRIPSNFAISAVLFDPSGVSSWGDGALDVAVVNASTKELYYRPIGPGDEACGQLPINCPAPRVFINLGGSIAAPPVLAAFSQTHLNLLVQGGDGAYYSSWSSLAPFQPVTFPPQRDPLLSWSGYENIGGVGLAVGNAAHAGRRNFAAVAVDAQGRLYINRNQEGRWTGFQTVIGQTPQMQLKPPLFMPALAAHGG